MGLIGQRELISDDVHKLVFECLDLIERAQNKLDLPICPNIKETRERLNGGVFRAEPLIHKKHETYKMGYALFEPPSTIILDNRIPFCNRALKVPEFPASLAYYSVTHELLHADDYTGGDLLLLKTREHILEEHEDKLEKGMQVVERNGGCDCIGSREELARLWALQYVDTVTHYRSFVVLRHRRLPRLDLVWSSLHFDFFSPNLFTYLEYHRGIRGVFEIITGRAGEYCLIEALKESESIREKNSHAYTV